MFSISEPLLLSNNKYNYIISLPPEDNKSSEDNFIIYVGDILTFSFTQGYQKTGEVDERGNPIFIDQDNNRVKTQEIEGVYVSDIFIITQIHDIEWVKKVDKVYLSFSQTLNFMAHPGKPKEIYEVDEIISLISIIHDLNVLLDLKLDKVAVHALAYLTVENLQLYHVDDQQSYGLAY